MSKQALVVSRVLLANTVDQHVPTWYETYRDITFCHPIPSSFWLLEAKLVDRSTCETDPDLLQLIPYIVVKKKSTGQIFSYQRGKAGNEQRLHGCGSIGLGGHVELEPSLMNSLVSVIALTAANELYEEIGLDLRAYEIEALIRQMVESTQGIYSENGAAGPYHYGILIELEIEDSRFGELEKHVIVNPRWQTLDELRQLNMETPDYFEEWSKAVLARLN